MTFPLSSSLVSPSIGRSVHATGLSLQSLAEIALAFLRVDIGLVDFVHAGRRRSHVQVLDELIEG